MEKFYTPVVFKKYLQENLPYFAPIPRFERNKAWLEWYPEKFSVAKISAAEVDFLIFGKF